MKIRAVCRWLACIAAMLCLFSAGALAEEWVEERVVEPSPLCAYLPVSGGMAEVRATEIDGETWLFLPAFAGDFSVKYNGREAALEIDGEDEEEGVIWAQVLLDDETALDVNIMQSANLRAMFLFSSDPVNEGRAFIDSAENHSTETSGRMAMIGTDGVTDYAGDVRKLRGRGNGTWGNPKKPYQIKLEDKTDLLQTGLSEERDRTWLLLAEASGSNMLHNRITLDMGLELGLEETPRSEYVDLYYDGEYRGTYLLCEKVEIGEGRVDEADYDEMMEIWNDQIGLTDLDALPLGEGVSRYGNRYTYVDGLIESSDPSVGAYLVELNGGERCEFTLSDKRVYSLKNPENPGPRMMDYISTRFQEAMYTVANGGVNPENGRTLEDDFDVDGFARTILVQELSYNYDGFRYSSTYFVLPAGELRLRPGPLWDFDLAWRYIVNGVNANAAGFKEDSSWMYEFYQCDAFVEKAKQIYRDELYPMVKDILLGGDEGEYLRSLESYAQEISASRRMNGVLWEPVRQNRYLFGLTQEEDQALLRQFIEERCEWLWQNLAGDAYDNDTIVLWASAQYAHVEEAVYVHQRPWNNAAIQSWRWTQLSEATEEEYARWELEVNLAPKPDCRVPRVLINGTEVAHEVMEDGTLRVLVQFEDPSYRPVDYYGDDIGWVYNYDVYVENYPEIAEECEYDPEMVMEYFCSDGMYEDHMANAFFRPSEVLRAHPELEYSLGEDWQMYYWDYLYYGRETDEWTKYMGKCFWLDVLEAE